MSSQYRLNAENALLAVITIPKNAKIIESSIFKLLRSTSDIKNINDPKFIDIYKRYIYLIIGDILSGNKLTNILLQIKNRKILNEDELWNHECFEKIANKITEQDNFIVNPFNIEKGVLKCNKCNSDRVYSYSKMTRSSDESITTFAQCVSCKSKWTQS